MSVVRISPSELSVYAAAEDDSVRQDRADWNRQDRVNMAVPSYLHGNPLVRWLIWRRYDCIARLAELRPEMAVLEFGCGLGVFLPHLHGAGCRVFATDRFTAPARALSAARQLPTEFVETLDEIPDGVLHLITAADVLEYLDIRELPSYLEVMRRKLADGGRLILSSPTKSLIYKLGQLVAGFSDEHDPRADLGEVLEHVRRAGFQQRRRVTQPFRFLPAFFEVRELQLS